MRLLVCAHLGGAALIFSGAILACTTNGYTYAGRASAKTGYGITASITPLSTSKVNSGHISAWVGVGGSTEGEWLQVGFSGFPGRPGNTLYYEHRSRGSEAVYHELARGWPTGKAAQVAVLEMHGRVGYWRVWLNGKAETSPIRLVTNRRFAPIATGESFDTNAAAGCNAFLYHFEHVALATAPGGGWKPLIAGVRVGGPPARIVGAVGASFYSALRTDTVPRGPA
jgi:hypothetical protein